MDLSIFDEIIDDDLGEALPHDIWTSFEDMFPFDGDTNMQDMEDLKNDDIITGQKELKIEMNSGKRMLSWEEVSQYFNMPIEDAARELQMGETSLKLNCRYLNFKRWPSRKIRSLQKMIKHIQEQGNEGLLEDMHVREQVLLLEEQIESIKKNPDIKIEYCTKKMRQKGYKDNHKKKKLEQIDAPNHAQ